MTAGSLDATFGIGGYDTNPVSQDSTAPAVAVQAWDGKTILAGSQGTLAVYRYNTDGTPDTSFGVGGLAVGNIAEGVNAVVTNPATHQIDIVGSSLVKGSGSLSYYNYTVTQLNANGSLDTTFGTNGTVTVAVGKNPWDLPSTAALDSQGRLVVVGMSVTSKSGEYEYQDTILRFTTAGQLDTSFGGGSGEVNGPLAAWSYDDWDAVLIHSDSSITVEGQDKSQDVIASYSPTGTLQSRGLIQTPADPYDTSQTIGVGSVSFQPNGDLVTSQSLADAPNNDTVVAVARYTPTGALDTTFGNGGVEVTDLTTVIGYPSDPPYISAPSSLTVDPSGRVVLGGQYQSYSEVNGKPVFGPLQALLVRYTPGGELDSSFGDGGVELSTLGTYAVSAISNLTTQPDGDIIAVGWSNPTLNSGQSSSGSVSTLARYLGSSNPSVVVTQQPPTSGTAGAPFGLTVEAEDSSGNLLSSFNGTMTLALANNPGDGVLGGTLTATAKDGVATFSGVTLDTAAAYTLQVSGAGLVTALAGAITVTPATASQVLITQEPPSSVVAGVGFGLQATIEDQYGNVATSATNTVNVALATGPAGASLGGTLSATASHGLAAFYLTLTSAASGYTFQVSSTGLGSPVTTALTVTPAAAVGLLITQEPTSVVVNSPFTLVVEVVDAYGNVVTSDNNTVTIALGNNPSGAKLGGTKSVTFVNGVATFSGLTLNKVGTGYTILISSKGLTGATAGPINVTAS